MSKRNFEWEDYKKKITKKRTGKKKDEAGPSGLCLTVQRLSANVEGKCQKYSRIGALTLAPLEEEVTLPNIKVACKSHFKTNLECDILAGERGPCYADASQIQNWKVVHIRFIEKSRLQNSRIFCEHERRCRSIFEQKVWSECKNGEGEWGETLKNTTVRHPFIKLVQNYPFFQ